MCDRSDLAAPGDADHLRRLIGHDAPAGLGERPQSVRDMGRDQVMEQHHAGRLEKGQAGEGVALRGLAVVIAVDEDERPSASRLAKPDDRLGARLGNEGRRFGAAGAPDDPLELGAPARIGEKRFDDVQRRESGGDEMGGRPPAPRADLESGPSGKEPRAGVEYRGLVTIDEPHDRVAPVGPVGMIDVAPEPRPRRNALVELRHVGEQAVQVWRFQVVGDVVSGHRSKSLRRRRRGAVDGGSHGPEFSRQGRWTAANGVLRRLRGLGLTAPPDLDKLWFSAK